MGSDFWEQAIFLKLSEQIFVDWALGAENFRSGGFTDRFFGGFLAE